MVVVVVKLLLLLLLGTTNTGLCFMRKSRVAPSETDAMVGWAPRNRSSSEWYDILSAPEA